MKENIEIIKTIYFIELINTENKLVVGRGGDGDGEKWVNLF